MVKKPSTPPAKRPGFSLVLALVMAAALVVVIIVLAAFLKVESRLAINSVLLTRARLNTVASLRLAQGSMQLMLGPDTRITAPASAYDDPASTDNFDFPVLGVWRSWEGLDHETSNTLYLGRPIARPDYNLKATDNFNKTTNAIGKGRFLGWLTSNEFEPIIAPVTPPPDPPPLPPAARFVATKPPGGTFNGTFNATPSLPKPVRVVPLDPFTPRPQRPRPQKPPLSAAPHNLPLWTNAGGLAAILSPALAYTSPLVGTETAKRIGQTTANTTDLVTLTAQSFPDSLTAQVSDSNFAWWVSGENQKAMVTLETPPAAIGGTTTADVLEAARRARTFGSVDLAALGLTLDPAKILTADPNLPSRASFDAAIKNGIVTVSTANKAGFHDYTTYAPGLLINAANGGFRRDLSLLAESWDWINQIDSSRTVKLPLFRNRPKITNAANGADLLYGRPYLDGQAPSTGNKGRNALLYWWSDYSSIGQGNIDYTGSTNATYRGLGFIPPIRSWNTMVDYALQYRKAVVAGTPDKVVEMRPPDDRGTTGASNPMYQYHETIYRHPVVARMQFVFSATATSNGAGLYQRHIILQPVITFWNPYNVRLKVPDVTLNIKGDQLPIGFSLAINNTSIDPVIVTMGYWFAQGRWDALQLKTISPGGIMDLGPGETRVYSIMDNGSVAGARAPAAGLTPPGYPWLYPQTAGAVAAFNIKPGYIAGYNGGSGLWLTWRDDTTAQPARTSMGFAMRKLNTGRDAIGFDVVLGSTLNWARSTPVRFSFGNDIWTDSAMWLFQSLYGPDDPNVPLGYSYDSVVGTSRPFGTFAFGMRMANDGSRLNEYSFLAGSTVVNSAGFTAADYGIVSRGALQSSPFTCYTELGDKSAEVLVYNGLNQIGGTSLTQNGIRYFGCMHPINAPFDLWWRPLSGWSDSYAPQSTTSNQGFVVSGLDAATGLSTAVVAEQPVMPLLSLADLQNWDARGFNPAPPFSYGLIGNSDASPILPAEDVVGRWFMSNPPTNTYKNRNQVPAAFLQHDDRYCLNHVLFDDWFVSSLSPDFSKWTQLNDDSKGAAVVTELKTAWAKAIDGTAPLANRAYKPALNAAELAIDSQGSVTWTAPNTATNATGGGTKIPDAWLKLGAYLTVNGQFNVNSTSVPAWSAVLRSLRDQRIPVLKAGATTASLDSVGTGKTTLARLLPSPEGLSVTGTSQTAKSAALTGYNALTDAQLDQLAVEIVKQVRIRGPFLSLSEFVNRQLALPDGSATDPCLRGALQAALEVLQQSGASLTQTDSTKKSYTGMVPLYAAAHGKPTTPLTQLDKLNPAGFSADYINPMASIGNSSEGLPGWPRQADLLRRLAPIMSVRDETFTVRSLGEVMTAEGTARAWCEAVYQRLPEYVDPRIEPWKAPMGDFIPAGGIYPENPAKPYPYMANALFGRRLKLVSFRWLRADEI
jgi:hypothetical protein